MLFQCSSNKGHRPLWWILYLTYYLRNPLRVWKHIRPRLELATGFCRVLVFTCDLMSSCFPLNIFLSTVLFQVSFGVPLFRWSSGVHLRAIHGSAAGGTTNPFPTFSPNLLCNWFCSYSSTQLVVWDCVWSVYKEDPSQAPVLEDV